MQAIDVTNSYLQAEEDRPAAPVADGWEMPISMTSDKEHLQKQGSRKVLLPIKSEGVSI